MSKLLMFDFKCASCDVTFEDLVQSEIRQLECPKCGATACRQISPVRLDYTGMATQEGFPSAADHFSRTHRERKAIEDRSYREHGDYGAAAGSDGGVSTPEKQAGLD